MEKLITVRGAGTAHTAPDQIVLDMNISSRDIDYDKAMVLASERIASLRAALEGEGFTADALKTVNFNVSTYYEGYHDDKGIYHNVFGGYNVMHALKLEFPFDADRLSAVISAIAKSGANPELNISFTVREPAAIKRGLLRSAAENARSKAEVLCEASGVKLGALVRIDYDWSHVNTVSNTRFAAQANDEGAACCKASMFGGGFTPEDIHSSDSAAFVWEIEAL